MMNIFDQIANLGINPKFLDAKKQQTDYKIKYVREYIARWVRINANRAEVSKLNFIDCMCNAGVYSDGDLCTATEVLAIFIEVAPQFQSKTFHLYINDFDPDRIDAIQKVIDYLMPVPFNNIEIHILQTDVNEYLTGLSLQKKRFDYGCATVLYVDPYDFRTVKISCVRIFLERFYCELVFNFFISDYVRNGIDNGIRKCIDDADIHNKEQLIDYIAGQLKVGRMKHLFAYKFKTLKNTELYQIIFVTPSKRGLEVLKESLWKVFNGQFYHRNKVETEQLCMFTAEDDKTDMLDVHAREAKALLLAKFPSQCITYDELEIFIIENTMLSGTQIIRNVLFPLMESGQVIKKNLVQKKSNYKGDQYYILGGTNENF